MWSLTLKGLGAHKVRLITTAVAIVLATSFLTGTLVLTDTIGKTFDDLFADVYRGTDAVVRGEAVFEGPQNTGDQRPRVDASLVQTVRRVDGVATVEGSVFGYTRLVGKDGEALGDPAMGAPTIGFSWSRSPRLNPFRLAEGRAPRADDEIVIDKKSAADGDLSVADTATVLTQGPPQRMKIVGIARFGTADSPGGASSVLFTLPTAQRLVAEPGKYDSISVVADDGVSEEQVVKRIAPVLPPDVEVVSGSAITSETQSDIRDALSFFDTFMLVFAVIALLVGAYMIFNTFSITVAQRTRESALLRALGATKRAVFGMVLLEAVVIGVIASILGLALGIGVALLLQGLLTSLGFELPGGGLVITGATVAVTLITGTVITTVAAASPARKAGKVPPVAAMRDIAVGSTGYGSKERVIVGAVVIVIGVLCLFVGLFADVDNAFAIVGAGALLVFFGVSVLGRTVALPLSRVIGWPLPRLRGMTGEVARENAMRNPKRTAATASALMIGVGLVSFITILAASTKSSIDAAIDRGFTGDFILTSGGGLMGGVDRTLAERASSIGGVETATGISQGAAQFGSSVKSLIALDPSSAFDVIDVDPRSGSAEDLAADAVAVQADEAEEQNLEVGGTIPVTFKDTGRQRMRVALIYDEKQPAGVAGTDYILGRAAYDANFTNHLDNTVFVKLAPGADSQRTERALAQLVKQYPGAEVRTAAGYKEEQSKAVDQVLALVYALLALAIFIALLGIGNTLALSILERTREVGLLRAVGTTRAQLRSMIRWESVIIAVQGTAIGLVIGVFFGWALVAALNDQGIDRLSIPVLSLVIVVVLAGFAGVAAAILPARRAAKLDVLRAVASE
jgi:putative ABC transport system permease protein